MNRAEMIELLRRSKYGVEASVSEHGAPQAAVVGIAVSDQGELVFDTLDTTRKCANLRRDPRVAIVIGWDEAQTVQIEGDADEPTGADRERLIAVYLAKFPDGEVRRSWPGITYWRVTPRWARYSDFRGATPVVIEVAL